MRAADYRLRVPRRARIVFEGLPHHVTQRGNNRQRVFFERGDNVKYLDLLHEHALRHGAEVIAYCLMPNHVHLVVVPSTPNGLQAVLKPVHGQFAQRINRMKLRKGHLWQGRFFSSALDASYLLNAVRYVELNPVRARLTGKAEDYPWSSAAMHCGLAKDPLVDRRPRSAVFDGIKDWSRWLAEGLAPDVIAELRRNASQNVPCGSDEFINQLESVVGQPLRYRPSGGQPKPTRK